MCRVAQKSNKLQANAMWEFLIQLYYSLNEGVTLRGENPRAGLSGIGSTLCFRGVRTLQMTLAQLRRRDNFGGRVSLSRRHLSSTEENRPANPGWRSLWPPRGAEPFNYKHNSRHT